MIGNMNYELAKQLKDAGFPQDGKKDVIGKDNIVYIGQGLSQKGKLKESEVAIIPTLEELIDACGRPIMIIGYEDKRYLWQAYRDTETITDNPVGEGKSPTEAVAKLWLELNKK